MTADELKAIRERCEKATPGRWRQASRQVDEIDRAYVIVDAPDGKVNIVAIATLPPHGADAEFISAAKQDVPALLAYVSELRSAAADALQYIERNETVHGRAFGAGNSLRKVLGE